MPYIFHDDGAPEADDFDSNWDYVEEDKMPWNLGEFDSEWDKALYSDGRQAVTATSTQRKKNVYTHPSCSLWARIVMLFRH